MTVCKRCMRREYNLGESAKETSDATVTLTSLPKVTRDTNTALTSLVREYSIQLYDCNLDKSAKSYERHKYNLDKPGAGVFKTTLMCLRKV